MIKAKHLFVAGIAILSLLALRRPSLPDERPPGAVTASARMPVPPALPAARAASATETAASGVSPECTAQWNGILAADVEAPQRFRQSFSEQSSGWRCGELPQGHPLACAHEDFLDACERLLPAELSSVRISPRMRRMKFSRCERPRISDCREALLSYRRDIKAHLARNVPLDRMNDKDALLSKYETALTGGDPAALVAVASRLRQLDPHDTKAERMLAFARYREAQSGDEQKLAAFRDSLAGSGNDAYLAELRLSLSRKAGDVGELNRIATELSRSSGTAAPVGEYYLAWAARLRGDNQESERILERLVESHPDDSRARSVLSLLKSKAPGLAQFPLFTDRADDVAYVMSSIE